MEITLYYAPIACSLVPYVTLTEANANFSVQTINLQKGQQNSADYLRLNPKHKVPLLLVDGKPLTENVAIQIWIAHNFPKAALLPSDPWQELRAISMLSWCPSSIHPLLSRINSRLRFAMSQTPATAFAGWLWSHYLRITKLRKRSWRDVIISSTILQPSTRISSGVSDVDYNLSSMCQNSRTV
jgi:glutathione S-transferase